MPLFELVSTYRELAEACARTPFPTKKWNKASEAVFPVEEELTRRGSGALREILPLLTHSEEWVRFFAARDCYSIAPQECSEVLLKMFHDIGVASSAAILILLKHEPTFAGYFSEFVRSKGKPTFQWTYQPNQARRATSPSAN